MDQQRSVIQNPNSVAFQESYVCLGKTSGKNQLRADCQRLQIRVSVSALQAIEKGYSHKMRVSYSNSENAYHGAAVVWNDDKLQTGGNFAKKLPSKEQVELEKETKRVEVEAKRLDEKKKRVESRKTKKWEKMKKQIAAVDSWEDIVI